MDDDDYDEWDAAVDAIIEASTPPWERDFDKIPLVNGAAIGFDGRFTVSPERDYEADGRTPPHPDALKREAETVKRFLEGAIDDDAGSALRAVRALREHIEMLEQRAVVLARSRAWSWNEIGWVLGVARQTVHARYAREEVEERKRRRPRS